MRYGLLTCWIINKKKRYSSPTTGHEGPGGGGGGGRIRVLAPLQPGKRTVPILQETGWASRLVWMGAENLNVMRIQSPILSSL